MIILYHPWLKGSTVDYYRVVNKVRNWLISKGVAPPSENLGSVSSVISSIGQGVANAYNWIATKVGIKPDITDTSAAKLTLESVDKIIRDAQDIYNYTHAGPLPSGYLLKKGMYNNMTVAKLQSVLQALGYNIGPTGVDGDFGSYTEQAVKAFQRDYGLNADGVVGNKTSEALLKAANAMANDGGFLSKLFDTAKGLALDILNGKKKQEEVTYEIYNRLAQAGGYKGMTGGNVITPTFTPSYGGGTTPYTSPTTPSEARILGIPTKWLLIGGLAFVGVYMMEKKK